MRSFSHVTRYGRLHRHRPLYVAESVDEHRVDGRGINVGFLRPFVSAVAFAPVTHAPTQEVHTGSHYRSGNAPNLANTGKCSPCERLGAEADFRGLR